ncbi:MAG: hypothetical protein ABSE52_03385 [Candidatus Dormibacteria bacterium]
MAEAEQVEAGLAGSAPSDDRVEPASVATVHVAPPPPEPAAATAPPAAPGAAALDHEPSASVRGVPTWTFALPSVPAPPAPPAIGSPAVAAGGPAAAMPPPPPPPPPTTGVAAPRTSTSPAVQLLAVPSLGPAGRRRHPLAVALLSVITLGAYTVGWHARVNREMSDFDARLEVRSGASVFGVALAWLAGLLCTLAGAAIIVAHALGVGPALARLASGPVILGVTVPWHDLMLGGLLAVPYLTLLLPLSVVALVMTLERARLVQERVGVRPDRQLRPAARACLLLLPVVGGLCYVASLQSALNRVWQATPSLAPPAGPRRR